MRKKLKSENKKNKKIYERYGVNIAPDSNASCVQQVEGVSLISFRRQSTLLQ